MTPIDLLHDVISPALKELAPHGIKPSDAARRMLISICLQESGPDLEARYQMNGGPARGLPQFERIAVLDVMTRKRTEPIARQVIADRFLPFDVEEVHEALAKDDRLALIFARLNLWNDPSPLPVGEDRGGTGWEIYLDVWRPGAYTRGAVWERTALARKWERNWLTACRAVDAEGLMP